jgi:hypothetical protein
VALERRYVKYGPHLRTAAQRLRPSLLPCRAADGRRRRLRPPGRPASSRRHVSPARRCP